jgi:hypothetical protein
MVNYFFLHTPATVLTSYQFGMKVKGVGILSNEDQTRKYDSIVLPADYPAAAASSYTVQTFSTSGTTWTSMGIDASVTLSSSTDLVLLLATAVYNADAVGSAKFTIFRDGAEITSGLTLQTVGGFSVGKNRQVTMAYVDAPGSTGAKTYSAMAAKLNVADGAFSVSESGRDLRQTIAVVFPPSLLMYSTNTFDQTVSSTTWTTVGLSVTVTPFEATDAVLIIVNINFNPLTAASIGAYTIFQDETNLGTATSGIAYIKTPAAGETAIASMSYLHLPGTSAPITYSVRCLAVSGSFAVSSNGQTRSIIALIQSQKPPTTAPTPAPTTSQPTVSPTPAPSFAPTPDPTTSQPTVSPTLAMDDCRASCIFPTEQAITSRMLIRRVQLATSFSLEFDVKVPAFCTYPQTLPLIELVDSSTGSSLVAILLTDQIYTGISYNGVQLSLYGVQFVPQYATAYTTFKIAARGAQISVTSSSNPYYTPSYPISGAVDTTGSIYELYLSSTVSGPSGGSFRNIIITGKSFSSPSLHSLPRNILCDFQP